MRKGINDNYIKLLFLFCFEKKNRSNGLVYMLHIIQSLVHDIDNIKEGKENIALRYFHNT